MNRTTLNCNVVQLGNCAIYVCLFGIDWKTNSSQQWAKLL